jgi:hypothetical protein
MIYHLFRQTLLVVLLLLTSGGTASAECAWLLWNQLLNLDLRRLHHTNPAFLSLAECNKVQRDLQMDMTMRARFCAAWDRSRAQA